MMNDGNGVIRLTAKPWIIKIEHPYAASSATSSTIMPPQSCASIFPAPPPQPPPPEKDRILKVDTFQYVAICDGLKYEYTNAEAQPQYGSSDILNPLTVSYTNLFLNGMLQPLNVYKVETGLLTLNEVPVEGTPLTLQFVKIYHVEIS